MQKYEIRTLEDMSQVVNSQNIDVFLADLKLFLEYKIESKKIKGCEMDATFFKWIDNGKIGLRKLKINLS